MPGFSQAVELVAWGVPEGATIVWFVSKSEPFVWRQKSTTTVALFEMHHARLAMAWLKRFGLDIAKDVRDLLVHLPPSFKRKVKAAFHSLAENPYQAKD